ncbi:hypothetical protein [Enterovibrio coralii]|uniref:Uncharacterized protein n=1 Tax=Enterovibrio coralii TaxID=294935 RepID=A0A135I6K3_9GAMM|nr:hypothetical protein [Enterovibrio coralii]KXF81081.1 hypothetical protein ATN88_19140 [Enterovibrio coralii]
MTDSLIYSMLTRTSDVYYCGDHLSGDIMMAQCLNLLSKTFAVETQRGKLLEILADIKEARARQDFTALGDIFRHEVIPYLSLQSE